MTVAERMQYKANVIARRSGYHHATTVLLGKEDKIVSRVEPGYRKRTTGEYVCNAYRNNFGWKNTYYQKAITVVELNEEDLFVDVNDPRKAGQLAGRKEYVGFWCRYVVYPIHTRFENIQWFVGDMHESDEYELHPKIVGQYDSRLEAIQRANDLCEQLGEQEMDEMIERIKIAMRKTWDYIADDTVEVYGGEVPRDGVIEMVSDADRLEDLGGDKEAVEVFRKMNKNEQDNIWLVVFPDEFYE